MIGKYFIETSNKVELRINSVRINRAQPVMILTEKSLASVKVGMWQYFLQRSRLVRESIVWVSISKVFFLCVLQVDNFCTIKVKRNTQFSLCFFVSV